MGDMKTISDLIMELTLIQQQVGDLPVLVSGYEGDYDEPAQIRIETVADKGAAEKHSSWWNGRYEDAETARAELPRFDAVVIPR